VMEICAGNERRRKACFGLGVVFEIVIGHAITSSDRQRLLSVKRRPVGKCVHDVRLYAE
jgi:hypothetical protein